MILVGIDVGGTFTDLIEYNVETEEMIIEKIATTTNNPELGILSLLEHFRDSSKYVSILYHATTIATNALLTRQGLARTALITNHGFRDILEIARQRRPELYNLHTERPTPLVQRKDRYTVHGRILADGSEYISLPEVEAQKIAKKIIADRYEAVGISFLNSHMNPKHEIRTRELILKSGFKGPVNISSNIDHEYREYERTSTTVVNTVLSKPVSSYLTKLLSDTSKIGLGSKVYIMKSDGTSATLTQAIHRPVCMIESGPAAGVMASQNLAKQLRIRKMISFDMGGTTAKASAIVDAQPDVAYEFEAAGKTYHGRSLKGSGYAVRQPFIDLAEVSSGGGTIAWVDEIGSLRLGPQSAGAKPGPAAYGKGGMQPTVTDANIVTGRINPESLLNGEMKLYYQLAFKSLQRISKKLHANIIDTALNIIRLANHSMAKALTLVSNERGRDPREFTLLTFGGAGPIHACELAKELGIHHVIVPKHPGMFSALGLLTTKISRSFSRSIITPFHKGNLERYFQPLRFEVQKIMRRDEHIWKYSPVETVDVRYTGQAYEITVPYTKNVKLKKLFDNTHRKLYGYSSQDPIEIVTIRIQTIVQTPTVAIIKKMRRITNKTPKPVSTRQTFFSKKSTTIPVYDRTGLAYGMKSRGPCIIQEYDSTTLIGKGWTWNVDKYGNLDLEFM